MWNYNKKLRHHQQISDFQSVQEGSSRRHDFLGALILAGRAVNAALKEKPPFWRNQINAYHSYRLMTPFVSSRIRSECRKCCTLSVHLHAPEIHIHRNLTTCQGLHMRLFSMTTIGRTMKASLIASSHGRTWSEERLLAGAFHLFGFSRGHAPTPRRNTLRFTQEYWGRWCDQHVGNMEFWPSLLSPVKLSSTSSGHWILM